MKRYISYRDRDSLHIDEHCCAFYKDHEALMILNNNLYFLAPVKNVVRHLSPQVIYLTALIWKCIWKGSFPIIYFQSFEVKSTKDQEENLGGCGTQGHLLSYNKKEKVLTNKAGNQGNSCLIQNFSFYL